MLLNFQYVIDHFGLMTWKYMKKEGKNGKDILKLIAQILKIKDVH